MRIKVETLCLSLTIGVLNLLTLPANSQPAQTEVSGGAHIVASPQYPGGVRAINGATFNVLNGGSIGAFDVTDGLVLEDTSSVDISGGSISSFGRSLVSYGSGPVNISGGSIGAGSTYGVGDLGSANFQITGGSIFGDVIGFEAEGTGILDIAGGLFSGYVSALDIVSTHTGATNISGGTFAGAAYAVTNHGAGVTNVSGGTFSTSLSDPHYFTFVADSNNVTGVYGAFNFFGMNLHFEDLGTVRFGEFWAITGRVVGTLADGNALDSTFASYYQAKINLFDSNDPSSPLFTLPYFDPPPPNPPDPTPPPPGAMVPEGDSAMLLLGGCLAIGVFVMVTRGRV